MSRHKSYLTKQTDLVSSVVMTSDCAFGQLHRRRLEGDLTGQDVVLGRGCQTFRVTTTYPVTLTGVLERLRAEVGRTGLFGFRPTGDRTMSRRTEQTRGDGSGTGLHRSGDGACGEGSCPVSACHRSGIRWPLDGGDSGTYARSPTGSTASVGTPRMPRPGEGSIHPFKSAMRSTS